MTEKNYRMRSGKTVREVNNNMLQEFKNVIIDRLSLDELVAYSSFGKQLRAEYEAHNVEVPEFVSQNLKTLSREIQGRVADSLAARKKQIESQIEGLRTPAEKREALQRELEKLQSVGV